MVAAAAEEVVVVDCAGRAQAVAITAPLARVVVVEEEEEETRVMIGREVCLFVVVSI